MFDVYDDTKVKATLICTPLKKKPYLY